jgi:hypothetical protein
MTPQIAVGICSVAGAILFFTAGFLFAKLKTTNGEKRELEKLKEENRILKSQNKKIAFLQETINKLEAENTLPYSNSIILNDDTPQPLISPAQKSLGGVFQRIANQLSEPETSHGAVLADHLGLVIAGTGNYIDEMAGMAAVFSNIRFKVTSMLPIDDINYIKIGNRQNLTLSILPFDIAANEVIITTLFVGPAPSRKEIKRIIKNAGRQAQ